MTVYPSNSEPLTPVTVIRVSAYPLPLKGEKLDTEFCIDWLHVNEPFKVYSLLASHIYKPPQDYQLTPGSPRHGYTEAMANRAGAVAMRNPNRSDMGVHVGYSGRTLNKYRDYGVNPLVLLRWHIGRGGAVSRIDLAFDVKDTPLNVQTLYEHLINGRATTTAKTYNLICGNDGGATCYVGSRTSEAFLRIYDKGIESGLGGEWVRVELELKSSKARFAAYTMANEPDASAFRWAQGWLQGFVSFPDTTWRALMTMEAIPLARANKPEPDTRQWLINLVAPAMAKYIERTGDYAVYTEFTRIVGSGVGLFDTDDLQPIRPNDIIA